MRWRVDYELRVLEEDIPAIDYAWRVKIKEAVEHKLTLAPEVYGRPLRGKMFGYSKLRVGDFRVIFQLKNKIVKVMMMGHRSDIYLRFAKYLKNL